MYKFLVFLSALNYLLHEVKMCNTFSTQNFLFELSKKMFLNKHFYPHAAGFSQKNSSLLIHCIPIYWMTKIQQNKYCSIQCHLGKYLPTQSYCIFSDLRIHRLHKSCHTFEILYFKISRDIFFYAVENFDQKLKLS